MNRRQLLCTALAASGLAATRLRAAEAVRIGFQRIYNPWKVAIATGRFEAATGWDIAWKRFDSGAKVVEAMAAGEVDIALAGSSPIAAGIARGIDLELFWITEDIASAEALVVRDGSGIEPTNPLALKGKTIGVPFVSTTHFHTLYALEVWGIDPGEVEIVDLQPNEIVEAWDRGEIDAGFVWDPALGRIKQTGKVMITSGELSQLGKATFDGMVAAGRFARANADGMARFVKVMADADAAYRDDPDSFTPESAEVQMIASLVGGNPVDVPAVLALYAFPSLEEQASARWLGGGADGGAAKALFYTSAFLKAQGKVERTQDDYSAFVNPAYADAALKL